MEVSVTKSISFILLREENAEREKLQAGRESVKLKDSIVLLLVFIISLSDFWIGLFIIRIFLDLILLIIKGGTFLSSLNKYKG